jgi:hypothetical protein
MSQHDEHEDDIEPEVQEGAEIELQEYPIVADEAEEQGTREDEPEADQDESEI